MNQEDINKIFDTISSYYDKINNFISFGTHKKIKKDSIKLLEIAENAKIIDLCTGTGDFVEIISKIYPNVDIIGLDKSEAMLKLAKNKNPNNTFIQSDCTKIPFGNSSFDFITMGFGLRNIIDSNSVINEIYRILKPNGKFLHLDFGKHNFLNKIFNIVVPLFVKIVGCDEKSYKYLCASKEKFYEPKELIKLFEGFGFKLVKQKDYFFGAISVQIMEK